MSCNFMPRYTVCHFHVLQSHIRHFQPPPLIHAGVWGYMYQCARVRHTTGGACMRSHRRNKKLRMIYFNFVTIKLFKWTASWKSNYADFVQIVSKRIWSMLQTLRNARFTMPPPHLLTHPTLVHISSHSWVNGDTQYNVTQSRTSLNQQTIIVRCRVITLKLKIAAQFSIVNKKQMLTGLTLWDWGMKFPAPLKLRLYGAIQICLLLLLY